MTKVLITGSAGSFHAKQCLAYGTQVVAGCTPNRGGETFAAEGPGGKAVSVPVFEIVLKMGGSISAEHGIGVMKRDELPEVKDKVAMDVMRGIKALLDPLNILNPGKVL